MEDAAHAQSFHAVYQPASFFLRLLASIVDSLIMLAVWGVLAMLLSLVMGLDIQANSTLLSLLQWCSSGIYGGYFYSRKGATPGKKVFHLQVVDRESRGRIGFWRGFFRDTIGKGVSTLSLGIGYLMAAFTRERMALHDYIFDTRVTEPVT